MQKKTVPIRGMHCRSCEIVLTRAIEKIPGVESALVSERKKSAVITYNGIFPDAPIHAAVHAAGYEVGEAIHVPFFAPDTRTYSELLLAFGILGGLFLWANALGVFNLSFAFPENPPLSVVLLIGLAAGISTCMALVGGLVLGVSARYTELHPEASLRARFVPHLFFQMGRVLSFVILGGVVGVLGGVLGFSGKAVGVLIVLAGLLMLFLGISLTDLFPRLTLSRFTLPSGIAKALGVGDALGYSHRSATLLGALTFFLPCGFTQAMQLYAASTGSFVSGALVMGVFALGTAPGLLGIGGLVSLVRGSLGRIFFKTVALLLIVLGVLQAGNGLRVFGIDFFSPGGADTSSEEIAGSQVIRMTQKTAGYVPSRFTVKKGVPVRWVIDSKDAYACAAYLVVPSLGISQALKKGENVINFTPQETGTIGFSCAMGMYRGIITVTE